MQFVSMCKATHSTHDNACVARRFVQTYKCCTEWRVIMLSCFPLPPPQHLLIIFVLAQGKNAVKLHSNSSLNKRCLILCWLPADFAFCYCFWASLGHSPGQRSLPFQFAVFHGHLWMVTSAVDSAVSQVAWKTSKGSSNNRVTTTTTTDCLVDVYMLSTVFWSIN